MRLIMMKVTDTRAAGMLIVVLGLFAFSCGGDSGVNTGEDAIDQSGADSHESDNAIPWLDVVFPEVSFDNGPGDVCVGCGDAEGLHDAVTDDGPAFEPCENGDTCASGICIELEDGSKVCAPPCLEEECPPGWECKQIILVGEDVTLVCLPVLDRLCRPCEYNEDCRPNSLNTGDMCVDWGEDGSFCGQDCSQDGTCPDGYTCIEFEDGSDRTQTFMQCLPLEGECECTPSFIENGFSTECYVENEHGTCWGERTCAEGGLTDCDAAEPQAEECNGQDDNCDGTTDEGIETGECEKTFEEYVCTGPEVCEGGELVCKAQEPEDEKCDGIDNDCNGTTDEEDAIGCQQYFMDADADSYGLEDESRCLCAAEPPYSTQTYGDCDDADPEINPMETEKCNDKDDDCDGQTDENFPDKGNACDGLDGDLCEEGLWDCKADGTDVECTDNSETNVDVCNNFDDDCDGDTDEDFPDKGLPCDGADGDNCLEGLWECNGTVLVCSDSTGTLIEICNNIDDDCDGQTDENFPDKGLPCDGIDGDNCLEGTWECNGTALVCSDNTGTNVEVCNNADDDCDGATDDGLTQPCSTMCGSGTETCQSGFWVGCTAQQPIDCMNYTTCGVVPMCVSSCPSAPPDTCNDKDDDCDGDTDEPYWNDDYNASDFPDTWYGPTLYQCTSGSCQGTTSGRLLPMGDEDWLAVYKKETVEYPWDVDLHGKVWFNGPAVSNKWYEVCICWTKNSVCDESSQVCATSMNGAQVILETVNDDDLGNSDDSYLDIVVRPHTLVLDWTCTKWSLTWSVWE